MLAGRVPTGLLNVARVPADPLSAVGVIVVEAEGWSCRGCRR